MTVNLSHTLPWWDGIEVEVLDARSNERITGYSTLVEVSGPEIRLRFHFHDRARLYFCAFAQA